MTELERHALGPASNRHVPAPEASVAHAVRLVVRGRVQGVGFRPFVFRLAGQCGLGGLVCNTSAGVLIELEGAAQQLTRFQSRLVDEAPAAAAIEGIEVDEIAPTGRAAFVIAASDCAAPPLMRLPRDLATCAACVRDIVAAGNRRHDYPFTNCTACGPRYSIVEAMPYDRPATSMRHFVMCSACRSEYEAPADRRFHAQPNACADCGPRLALWDERGRPSADSRGALDAAVALLAQGRIVALKGLGGFQLLVRADQAQSVARLRQLKQRPSKPLAVMVESLAAAAELALLGPIETELLRAPANPIVLATKRPGALPESIAPRVRDIGLFLPTTPLHHLLLARLRLPVIATSGNRGAEPIITNERAAVDRLAGIADAFLVHDRPIVRHVDDSVLRVIDGRPMVLRLGRGYSPLPVPALEGQAGAPVLALGGHQKNAIAAWTGAQAILGQHLGDLDDPETRAAFVHVLEDMTQLYRFDPATLACDQHPDYFTSRWAMELGLPVRQVQHHHAHARACMAEHRLLDREVLALTWDGSGYGTDGTVWGGEILHVSPRGFRRLASLLPFPLPGGDAAIRQPARTALGLCGMLLGEDALLRDERWTRRLGFTRREAAVLLNMIRRGVNTPWTSSVGRLFDAVAAVTLGAHAVSHEGEAAAWLESVAAATVDDAYPLPILDPEPAPRAQGAGAVPRGDWRPLWRIVLDDFSRDVDVGVIAARLHNALANWAADVALRHAPTDVVLSGGCFQNRLLSERTALALRAIGRRVYLPRDVPPGDGGLAVGQLAAALPTRHRRDDDALVE